MNFPREMDALAIPWSVVFLAFSLRDIRLKAENAFDLSLKKKVVALACLSCGFIELFLAEHDRRDLA